MSFYIVINNLENYAAHEELLKEALVLETYREHKTIIKTAQILGLNRNTVRAVLKRFSENQHQIERLILRIIPVRSSGATIYRLKNDKVSKSDTIV